MKNFTAVTKDGTKLVDVIAADAGKAKDQIRRQLQKPGRQGELEAWQRDGEMVEEN